MLQFIVLSATVAFLLAYRVYGAWLGRQLELDNARPTPSHTDYDGVDRVPAHRAILLGHHFSSIAGAGPVIGPIIAAVAFGWFPALVWVVIGSIFIGGIHDFSSLVASIRHRARSIAEIAHLYMTPLAFRLFLLFIWLTLVYILVVFADLTVETFISDGGVASSSVFFVLLAIGFGLSVYRLRFSVLQASLIFVPLVFVSVWLGQEAPLDAAQLSPLRSLSAAAFWKWLLIGYCFVASTTPVWILLQPRDYLSSFLLYASILGGFAGILLGEFPANFPAFIAWSAPQLGSLFPILFITVACGACSGFHSMVASGTSSKQLDRESDAKMIGYGAMLIEGVVAVVALSTVLLLPFDSQLARATPITIYANGMSQFFSALGIPATLGRSFALLALSTFILTTLDTGTRLARYTLEELLNLRSGRTRYFSTLATLVLPAVLLSLTLRDASGNSIPAWKAIWPVFGATNQLMAGLTLLVVTVWLKRCGKPFQFAFWPMCFMLLMTMWSLVLLIGSHGLSLVGGIALVLFLLSLVICYEALRALRNGPDRAAA